MSQMFTEENLSGRKVCSTIKMLLWSGAVKTTIQGFNVDSFDKTTVDILPTAKSQKHTTNYQKITNCSD